MPKVATFTVDLLPMMCLVPRHTLWAYKWGLKELLMNKAHLCPVGIVRVHYQSDAPPVVGTSCHR